MNWRKLFNGLIVLSLLLPALLTGSPTPTRAAPEAARVPIGLNRPLLIGTAGVELSPGSNGTANPGSIVTYTHTLTNTGIDTDTFTLAASSSHGWPVAVLGATGALSLPLELEAGLTATLLVSLTVPTAAISGTLDTAILTATSQTVPDAWAVALDNTTVKNVIRYVYLPLVIKRWPPVPDVPVLNLISNPDGDGNYTVSWNAAYLASTYTLQEDDNAAFSSQTAEYTGPGTSWPASGKTAALYYYRVKATNSWGDSGWSNIQSVTVIPPPAVPVLNPISNPGGVGNYTVSWNTAYLADTYTLQEDDTTAFSSPMTQYAGAGTSWPTSGKPTGTYYYRVKATNISGDSGWSNIQAVTVVPPGTLYSIADADVLQGYPTLNTGSDTEMWAGYDDYLDPDGMIARSHIQFDMSAIPPGTAISSAILQVYLVESYDFPNRTRTITTYRISSSWSELSVTWNTRPAFAEAYGSAPVTHGAWGWYSFDVTNLVRGWINGSLPNYGVMLRGPEVSGSDSSWRAFSTREGSTSPQLVITYSGFSTSINAQPNDGNHIKAKLARIVRGTWFGEPNIPLCRNQVHLPTSEKCLAVP